MVLESFYDEGDEWKMLNDEIVLYYIVIFGWS